MIPFKAVTAMLIGALVLAMVVIGAIAVHRHLRHKRQRALLDMLRHAESEDRWVELVTQAHQTMSASEVQQLEQAMYLRARGKHSRSS